MTVAVYVHTFLQLSKYATDLIETEEKKIKWFINGLNPAYKNMVMTGQKPTLFGDAVDKVYMAKEVHREETTIISAKRSGSSWFIKGGQFNKNKKQKNDARAENKPVCETCGKAHKTEACWRNTGACLVYRFLEHKMAQCPKSRRNNKALQQQPPQGQAVVPAPPR